MKHRAHLTVLLVLALVFSACGSEGDSAPSTDDAGQQSSGSDGGEEGDGGGGDGSVANSSDDLPPSVAEGFPIAIPPGWEVDVLDEIGLSNSAGAQLLYPAEDFDDIVAYYEAWTAQQDTEYARTEAGNDVVFTGMESPIHWITVTKDHEERGDTFTYVLLVTAEG